MGVLYCKNVNFEAYCDSDYAGGKDTRKSTSGLVCKYANAAITWQSKRQQYGAISTDEAEYVSACLATKEIIWLMILFNDDKMDVDKVYSIHR